MTHNPETYQRGAVTLLVVSVLTLVMAVMTLTTTRVGVMEQRSVGNELRAKEAQEAAESGIEYGLAWAAKNLIPYPAGSNTLICPGGTGCPVLPTLTGSSTGESYAITSLFYEKSGSTPDFIKLTSTANGVNDTTITATTQSHIKQTKEDLFIPGAPMPPPWVIAGCITSAPTGTPDTYILSTSGKAAITGSPTFDPANPNACMPPGHLDVSVWADTNGDGNKQISEVGASTSFNVGEFTGCPSTNCAWNEVFKMPLADAKQIATVAGHVYTTIPHGEASSAPSIYIIENSGPINSGDIPGGPVIGAPGDPIVLIVPSAYDCPKFNGGITIYGIVYYESTTACAANGWGGATIYGSVIWEGDVDKPNANSEFIEVDWEDQGDLNDIFNMAPDSATRIPGTWKDF